MELENVLCMKGGNGDTSYGQSGYVSKRMISMTKGRREESMIELITNYEIIQNGKRCLCIVDLGCASGPNTLTVISNLIVTSQKIRLESSHSDRIEYQVYLNDLPGNDFNSVFQSLPEFYQQIKKEAGLQDGQLFIGGVPGSFYGRLFPTQSLHFVHSSYSLQWLSQVPNGIKDNRKNVCISIASPKSVVKAYKEQFQKDTQMFLKSRSKEVIKGGKMVLTYLGRSSHDPINDEICALWDAFAHALNHLVSQGKLEEEKLETFNFPMYHPSSLEVMEEVEKEGSFHINEVDISRMYLIDEEEDGNKSSDELTDKVTKLFRAVFQPLLATHFGETIADEAVARLSLLIATKHNILLTNVTISLTKK